MRAMCSSAQRELLPARVIPCARSMRGSAWGVAGFAVQAFYTGEGALGSLAKFANNFSPELAEKIAEF